VLTVILMSGRVIKYFGLAADGRMDVSLLSAVLLYRLPSFLDLLLPLGLFVGILLTFGRLYLDNEMAVLAASGISRTRMVRFLLLPSAAVMALVAFTSLWLTPVANRAAEEIFSTQASRNTFDMVQPGRFQRIGDRVLYAASISDDQTTLRDVKIYERKVAQPDQLPTQLMVAARYGRSETAADGSRYLVLEDGVRHELVPGSAIHRELHFATYRVRLPAPAAVAGISKLSSYSTYSLWQQRYERLAVRAELVWRISLSLVVPAAMLLAFSLSRVNPRQGRYLKLMPAILLYLSYIVALGAARNLLEKGRATEWLFVGVHLLYLAIGFLVLSYEQWSLRLRQWRALRHGAMS
jgi:lipopolysaccharide export system permease protein